MSELVEALRIVSVLAFAGPMWLLRGRGGGRSARAGGARSPVIGNFAAAALFVLALLVWSGPSGGQTALALAAAGALLAIAGAVVVLRSRTALGAAWSLVPQADEGTGLVTTGPYRLVRHPIYLGLILVATGQALAFGSTPALLVVLIGLVPTFVWRARAEEELLRRTFGARYEDYRTHTRMIIPYLL